MARKYNPKPRQAVALYNFLKDKDPKTGAEIGVFWGETFFYLLDNLPDLKLIGVDLWKPVTWGDKSDEGYREYSEFPMEKYYRDVITRAKNYNERAIIYKEDSVKAADKEIDRSLSFIFIDGDHTKEGVERDLLAWMPKIKPGGYLMGHDIHMPGVKAVVDKYIKQYKELDNYVWVSQI